MTDNKPKYQNNTDDSVQHIIKIKKSLKRKYVGTNYRTIQNAFLEVGYNQKALENDEWFIDLVIAKIKSDSYKPTYEFIMPIVYSILIAVLGLDFFKNNIFIVSVFLFFTIALILLAVWGVITDFKKSMLLEILTMIKNSGKIYEAIE